MTRGRAFAAFFIMVDIWKKFMYDNGKLECMGEILRQGQTGNTSDGDEGSKCFL